MAQPLSPFEQALAWIGFEDDGPRARVVGELGNDLTNFLRYTADEIDSLAKSMAGLPTASRVYFGLARTKLLKSMLSWAQDSDRIDEIPSMDGYEQAGFLEDLHRAEERAKIRVKIGLGSVARAKEASPGKLKDERGWDTWEQELSTHLGILLGVNGVPLTYVIRETEAAPEDVYASYFEETIAKARLEGPEFEADALQVHQIIRALTVGENAEQWLREIAKHKNGRRDMAALRAHYRGEGNQTRRVAVAQRLKDTLHYKNERAMTFSTYISKVKEMFNIYQACNEEMTEAAKLRYLWDTVQCPSLQPTVETLKAQLGQDPNSWNFVSAANHLASQIVPTPAGRQLSDVTRGNAASGGSGIYDRDGKIKLHGYSGEAWNSLTKEDKGKIMAERAKNKGNRRGGRNAKGGKQGGRGGMKELTKLVRKQTKVIAALSNSKHKAEEDDKSDASSSSANDAGNAFGGREGKQNKRKTKKPKT